MSDIRKIELVVQILAYADEIREKEKLMAAANEELRTYGTTIDEQLDLINDKTTST